MDRQSPVADPVGPNWGPKGRKKLFVARIPPPISKGLDDRGPPASLITKSASGTEVSVQCRGKVYTLSFFSVPIQGLTRG